MEYACIQPLLAETAPVPELALLVADMPSNDRTDFFHLLGIDPAVASIPLISPIADVSGVVIYFSIAAAILGA